VIYNLVEDIWGKEYPHKHYVVGDVLEAFLVNNSLSTALSITREEYLRKIRMGWVFRRVLGIPNHQYVTRHQKLLIGLKQEGIIKKIVITTKNDDGFNKVVIFKLNFKRINRIYLGMSSNPYDFTYIENIPFSINSFRDYIPAHRCNKKMVERIGDYSGCIKSNHIPYIVRSHLYDKYKPKLIELLKNELKGVDFDEYCKNLCNKKILGRDDTYNKIFMINACLNIKLDTVFYLPNFIDNRGRQYISGILSPTFNKYIREIIEIYDINDYSEKLNKSKYYNILVSNTNYLGKYKLFNEELNYYLMNLFIEIGKPYIKGNDNKHFFSLEDFILKGVEMYENGVDNIYTENVSNIINIGIFNKKIIIYKDATSSGLQNFGILAGYKKDLLKYLNLSGLD
jgi:hypothetical protein